MRYIIYLWFLGIVVNDAGAQNLVMDPSFEIVNDNYVPYSSYIYCKSWDEPMYVGYVGNPPSADYYNAVDNNQNFLEQTQYSGMAYWGGVWAVSNARQPQPYTSEDREMIQGKLIEPLQIGHKYKAWYYVSLERPYIEGACNNFCMGFSVNHVSQNVDISNTQVPIFNYIPRNISIKFCDTTIVTDSVNWVKVGGDEFIADSAYNYIIIGNLKKVSETKFILPASAWEAVPYYFIDEVHVEEVPDISQVQVANYLPTAFSPNTDGHNDFFKFLRPLEANTTTMQISIFNRWGNKVYTSTAQDFAWDGTYLGAAQPSGTYMWQVVFFDKNGNPLTQKPEKGNVTLLR